MGNPRAGIPVVLAVLGLALLSLLGCAVDKGGPEPDGGEGGLPVGHYLIHQDKDGELGNETWFVVLPDAKWELVDYFISYGNAVCGIGRTRGSYSLGDSGVTLIVVESAEGPDHCPITQDDFDDLAWEAALVGESGVLSIRNLTAHSFEARGAFAGTGWMILHRQDDPHGYYD